MGLQKVAFNFMVERGGKLAKSLLCTKPQKAVTNIKGLKLTQKIETDSIKIERKLSDFAQENREFLEKEFSELFGAYHYPAGAKRKLGNGIHIPASKSDIQELLYHVKDDYDVLVIQCLKGCHFNQKEICNLMKYPQKRILQCAGNYNPYYKEINARGSINAEQLEEILQKYPNLKEKYFSMLFNIDIPTAGKMTSLRLLKKLKRELYRLYDALAEKGYNPINQIVGYILSGDPTYITNYNNARKTKEVN